MKIVNKFKSRQNYSNKCQKTEEIKEIEKKYKELYERNKQLFNESITFLRENPRSKLQSHHR